MILFHAAFLSPLSPVSLPPLSLSIPFVFHYFSFTLKLLFHVPIQSTLNFFYLLSTHLFFPTKCLSLIFFHRYISILQPPTASSFYCFSSYCFPLYSSFSSYSIISSSSIIILLPPHLHFRRGRRLKKTRPDTRLPQSRAGGQGLYLRSLNHLGRSSKANDSKKS